jgi:hypothetical protein
MTLQLQLKKPVLCVSSWAWAILWAVQKNPGVRIQYPEEGFASGSLLRIKSLEHSDILTLLASVS